MQDSGPNELRKLSAAGPAKTTPIENPVLAAIFKQESMKAEFSKKKSMRNTKSDQIG